MDQTPGNEILSLPENVSQEDIMEIILDKTISLRRSRPDSSEDSSMKQAFSDKTEDVNSPAKKESKKARLKKKANVDSSKDHPQAQVSNFHFNTTENSSKAYNKERISSSLDSENGSTFSHHWYDWFSKGPFALYARKLGDRKTAKSVFVIEASRLLSKANTKFNSIEYHSWNTWKVICESFQEANSAIRNKLIQELV